MEIADANLTKDLGIGTAACGLRRNVQTSKERLAKMSKRLRKIKVLVRQSRRCRNLVWTGAKPQGTWGHQGSGLAPTTVL